MTIAEEIQREAWEAFERWCREYDPDGNLGALELAEAYDQFAVPLKLSSEDLDKPTQPTRREHQRSG